ncbi:MAG: phenylalanine--tRNA ligase subunit beta [Nitrospirae bacterium]|nr:phenylalanine--tRNA ligase subunit beta [Nitrospirota bacterium]
MKASYNWLKEFVDFSLPPLEIAHALTMAGLEVEGVVEADGDTVFDINVTPNRPDCLSIIGIAREISAILKVPFRSGPAGALEQKGRGPEVTVRDTRLCRRYASRTITGVKPAPSPDWLVRRLESHGIRTSINVVDITNYVLLETGQPLHAFDLDKLAGTKIEVRTAGPSEKFRTLDNEDRILNPDMLMICDAERPVALAGIIGGMNSEVSLSTMNVLLESANFFPSSVRRTAKALGVSTESSYRFERGVDINNVTVALDRAASMIAEIAGGCVSGLTDVYPSPFTAGDIRISFNQINSLIGIEIPGPLAERILTDLGFGVKREGEGLVVNPPSFRQDIQAEVDIIEEIARLYGYGNIPASLPSIQLQPTCNEPGIIEAIRKSLVRSGFTEVINYSFFYPDSLDRLNIALNDRRRDMILISNPLRKEESAMRTTLIPALLSNVCLNFNRGEKNVRFFEISRVFLPSSEKLPEEVVQVAAVYNKGETASLWETTHDGFYDVKGALENLFIDLKIKDHSIEQSPEFTEPYLHPGKSCTVRISDEKIASLGAVHPSVLESFDIRGNVIILEIPDVAKLKKYISAKTSFSPLPKFPRVERDIALVVSKGVTIERVRRAILSVDSNIIESVVPFDIYIGKSIPDDKKSIAFSILFRSADRTLTDQEVDALQAVIIEKLKKELDAELRG